MDDIKINVPHTAKFWVFDANGAPKTSVPSAEFGVEFSGASGPSMQAGTVIEIDDVLRQGEYGTVFTPTVAGLLSLKVSHPVYLYGDNAVAGEFRVVHQLADDINLQNLGQGNRQVTVIVQDEGSHAPVVGAIVEIYDGTLSTKVAFAYTNGDGQVPLFSLYDGAYKVVISKIGQYVFDNPFDMVVDGDGSFVFEGGLFSPSVPPSPDVCVVYGWEIMPDRQGVTVTVEAEIMAADYFLETNQHVIRKLITTSDPAHANGPGYWELMLTKTSLFAGDELVTYRFSIDEQQQGDYEIPNVGSIPFKDLIGM